MNHEERYRFNPRVSEKAVTIVSPDLPSVVQEERLGKHVAGTST